MTRLKSDMLNAGMYLILVGAVLGTIIYLTLELKRDPYRALGECERLAETHDINLVACVDIIGRNR